MSFNPLPLSSMLRMAFPTWEPIRADAGSLSRQIVPQQPIKTGISPMTLNRVSTVLMQKSLGMFQQTLQQMLTQTAMCLLATGGAICNS